MANVSSTAQPVGVQPGSTDPARTKGKTIIDDGVVAKIAGIAARGVTGVHALGAVLALTWIVLGFWAFLSWNAFGEDYLLGLLAYTPRGTKPFEQATAWLLTDPSSPWIALLWQRPSH